METKHRTSAQNLILNAKHSGGGVMLWACFTAMWPGYLAVNESTINFSVYQSIVQSNVAVCPAAKAWSKLDHVTEQWTQVQLQIYNRVV